jgi:excinuclease ABC subunit C
MKKEDIQKINVPDAPGVYFFLGKRKEILYIGMATSLRNRVRSYFDGALLKRRGPLIEKMKREACSLDWAKTDSILEAMLLEANLIRTHKPVFNTRSKDDKSFNHVVITDEDFPRVLLVRGKDLNNGEAAKYKKTFGPFPEGNVFKVALKIMRRLFQFYDSTFPIEGQSQKNKMRKGKIDFNRQIGLYPENISKEEYCKTIEYIELFFEGKKKKIIKDLERQMHHLAKEEQFEEAHEMKKKIFALKHIHDISLIRKESREYRDDRSFRIEAYDAAHLSGKNVVGVMAAVIAGVPDPSAYRKFIIRSFEGVHDPKAVAEMLERRLAHPEWRYPNIIVVDGSTAQKNSAVHILKKHNTVIPVVGVVKDERHKPKRIIGPQELIRKHRDAILLSNAEAHRFALSFHQQRRRKSFSPI